MAFFTRFCNHIPLSVAQAWIQAGKGGSLMLPSWSESEDAEEKAEAAAAAAAAAEEEGEAHSDGKGERERDREGEREAAKCEVRCGAWAGETPETALMTTSTIGIVAAEAVRCLTSESAFVAVISDPSSTLKQLANAPAEYTWPSCLVREAIGPFICSKA